jgi:hypothetical protein
MEKFNRSLFSKVLWTEESYKRIAFGVSEDHSCYLFAVGDLAMVMLESEVKDLYLALKSIFEKDIVPKNKGVTMNKDFAIERLISVVKNSYALENNTARYAFLGEHIGYIIDQLLSDPEDLNPTHCPSCGSDDLLLRGCKDVFFHILDWEDGLPTPNYNTLELDREEGIYTHPHELVCNRCGFNFELMSEPGVENSKQVVYRNRNRHGA